MIVTVMLLLVSSLVPDLESVSILKCATQALGNYKKYAIINASNCQMPICSSSNATSLPSERVYIPLATSIVTLLRIVAGSWMVGYTLYTSGPFSGPITDVGISKSINFKSSLFEEWSTFKPTQMKITLQDGNYKTVAWLAFQVRPSDNHHSWFNSGRLISCYPWQFAVLL